MTTETVGLALALDHLFQVPGTQKTLSVSSLHLQVKNKGITI